MMWIKVLIAVIFATLGGILYRMGGSAYYDKLYRRIGTPLCGIVILGQWWLPSTISGWGLVAIWFVLAYGAITTYWDSLFGYDNYYKHGFMAGIAAFPLCWLGIHWYAVLISGIVSGALMGLWSEKQTKDVWEEFGRGFIYCATQLLLLI